MFILTGLSNSVKLGLKSDGGGGGCSVVTVDNMCSY